MSAGWSCWGGSGNRAARRRGAVIDIGCPQGRQGDRALGRQFLGRSADRHAWSPSPRCGLMSGSSTRWMRCLPPASIWPRGRRSGVPAKLVIGPGWRSGRGGGGVRVPSAGGRRASGTRTGAAAGPGGRAPFVMALRPHRGHMPRSPTLALPWRLPRRWPGAGRTLPATSACDRVPGPGIRDLPGADPSLGGWGPDGAPQLSWPPPIRAPCGPRPPGPVTTSPRPPGRARTPAPGAQPAWPRSCAPTGSATGSRRATSRSRTSRAGPTPGPLRQRRRHTYAVNYTPPLRPPQPPRHLRLKPPLREPPLRGLQPHLLPPDPARSSGQATTIRRYLHTPAIAPKPAAPCHHRTTASQSPTRE